MEQQHYGIRSIVYAKWQLDAMFAALRSTTETWARSREHDTTWWHMTRSTSYSKGSTADGGRDVHLSVVEAEQWIQSPPHGTALCRCLPHPITHLLQVRLWKSIAVSFLSLPFLPSPRKHAHHYCPLPTTVYRRHVRSRLDTNSVDSSQSLGGPSPTAEEYPGPGCLGLIA